MLSEEVEVKFAGFEPSHEARKALYFVLNQLHLKSPSQSLLTATFTLTNGVIDGMIKVTSTAEEFVVRASDATIGEVGSKLFDKLGEKLEKWKSLRIF